MRMSSTSSRRRSKGNSKAKPVLAAGSRRVPSSTSNKNVLREKKKQCNQQNSTTFPFKLYEMLQHAQDSEFSSSISWLPNGFAFIIHDADVLMRNLAPMFFQQTKFRSFTRQLNIWGFVRTSTGSRSSTGGIGWRHKHFLRGQPDLLKDIERIEVKSAVNLRVKKDSTPASTPNTNTKVKRKASSPKSTNIRKASKTKQGQGRKCVKKEKAVFIDDSSSSSSHSRTDSQSSQSSHASDDAYIESVQLHEKNVDPPIIASAASNAAPSLPLQISSVITNFPVAYTDNSDKDVGPNNNLSNSIVTSDSFPLPTSPVLRSSSQTCSIVNNETISNQFYQPSATSFTDDDFLAHLEKIFDKHGGDDQHPSSSSDDDLLSILSLDQESTLSFL